MEAETVRLVIEASVMLTVLAVGLKGSLSHLAYVLGHARPFFKAMVAVNLVVPLAAVGLCLLFPIPRTTEAGIIVMAVSPLCPLALGKMLKHGADHAHVIGIYVALILASIILVPVTVALLGIFLGHDFAVPVSAVASLVAITVLLPLIAGMLIAPLAPRFAARAAPIVSVGGQLLLLPVVALILYRSGTRIIALLGDGTLLVIAITILAAFAAGHLLGGPKRANRLALAEAAATRHPAMAALIAGMLFDDREVLLAILLFLFAGLLLSALYTWWLKRHYFADRAKANPAQAG